MVYSPGLRSTTSRFQVQPLTVASRLHKPHIIEEKTPQLMVQATVNSQDQPRKLAQLQRKREKRGEKGEKLESKKEGSNQNYKIGKK